MSSKDYPSLTSVNPCYSAYDMLIAQEDVNSLLIVAHIIKIYITRKSYNFMYVCHVQTSKYLILIQQIA